MIEKRKIIVVTDGDKKARKAIEVAINNVGGRCISKSWGNPTELTGKDIVNLVVTAKYDPVVVMVDDKGDPGYGVGEHAFSDIVTDDRVEVVGVVAVASNTEGVAGVKVDFSIDCRGNIVDSGVDKNGEPTGVDRVYGDTVDILEDYNFPLIVGIGDIGKMNGQDDCKIGAPVITKAFTEILKRKKSK
ncbi:stage V sporulation protein AE [Clostridium sp. D2Q-11]|uniref:Stage V sporulation protein AE n=1 Tax=Anaeromonas frigoriresistens TaxID=2683708 RepID=A0A942UWY9_9FIRM|nr:stage V sporulation protein AE [Anaeromonas frigoriresistens]MBS4539625.1 stage V sporulation protein AE [Anaeromonas frigoriresistens]